MSNVTKAWSFLAIMSLTLIVLGHYAAGREGLMLALILVLGVNSYIYFYEDRRILALFSGQLLEGQDPYGVCDIAKRLATKARISTPKIVVLNEQAPQAAVVGRSLTHGTLILTEGLIRKLTPAELEGVIAYQIASIRTLNTLAFAVGSFLASTCLIVTGTLDLALRILIVERKSNRTAVSQLFTRAAAPFIGLLLRASIHASFYLSADQLASQLIREPRDLAYALWKLDSYSDTLPLAAPLSAAHVFIVSPLKALPWTRRLAAQPATPIRIKRLIGYFPI